MKLPASFASISEWSIVGPLGPMLPEELALNPKLVVDGGHKFVSSPEIWIGDGDSSEGEIHADHVFRLPHEKDQSDLGAALGLLDTDVHFKLHLWGFLGGRADHELFNFGELFQFLSARPESSAKFYDQQGSVRFHFLARGQWGFKHEGLFSLGTLRSTHVSLRGDVKYPILKETQLAPLSSFGLSNEAHGEVVLMCNGPVFIYLPENL